MGPMHRTRQSRWSPVTGSAYWKTWHTRSRIREVPQIQRQRISSLTHNRGRAKLAPNSHRVERTLLSAAFDSDFFGLDRARVPLDKSEGLARPENSGPSRSCVGHGFTACGKSPASYQGIALAIP